MNRKTQKGVSNTLAKEKLLDAAQRLMLSNGFSATTVDGICETAGLTKGCLFHYFSSKDDLGKAVLEHYWASTQEMIRTRLFPGKVDPIERISDVIAISIEMANNRSLPIGCLLGNFAQELSDTHPDVRDLCDRYFAQWIGAIKRDLDEASRKYNPRASIDTQTLAEHLVAVLEGSLILAKAAQDTRIIERNLRHFEGYIRSLFSAGKRTYSTASPIDTGCEKPEF